MAGSTSDVARWTNGAGTGNLATAGNWAVEAGTPSTPPAAGEVALFDGRANGDATAGLTTFASVTLGELRINGFQGNLGGSGGAMEVDATLANINNANGAIYLNGDFTTLNANNVGPGRLTLSGGTTTTANLQGGNYDVTAAAVVTNLNLIESNASVADNGTAITALRAERSSADIDRAITTANVDDNSRVRVTGAGNTVGTLNITGRATYIHNSSGTITQLNGYSGVFTIAGAPFSFTITNTTRYAKTFALKDTAAGITVTYSNPVNNIGVGDTD